MSAREELFRKLSEGGENAEQVDVRTDEDAGVVVMELEDENISVELDPDEARSFSEDLEADARDEGWYHAGQTKPFIEEIEESADSLE